ncbi:MAG: Na/Pi cotransporter family protein [Agathobacter sp.]|nr:Na/Pi cotransporter family protein [Agathobacter sp.]
MDIFNILTMIGGLALFLYGMNIMGDGLSQMAGGKLESVLERLTSKRIYAVLLGAGVTAVIQSSSATTVMVVGFVNSGIMHLSQAVGIIMGANIGTTMTSWLLSLTEINGSTIFLQLLKPSSFSPVLAAVGIILTMSSKEGSKKRNVGNILVGFAILMFGMETMSDAVSPLAENKGFAGILTKFSNPILGMIAGTVLTAIIQSSSASVGILQALCITGIVNYATALPIIMGQNIGTCITAIISSIGANKNAKRAAMIHLFFNLIGTIIFMIVFYSINAFVDFAFLDESASAAGIAVIHSLFNIGCCVVLYPFANLLVKLATVVIPDGAKEDTLVEVKSNMLDERFLDSPSFAIKICKNKSEEMAEKAYKSILLAIDVLKEFDEDKVRQVYELEDEVDRYEDELGTYLVKLAGKNLSDSDSESMSIMLHGINDFERISDHAINIVESAEEIREKELEFSTKAGNEIGVISDAVIDIVAQTVEVFKSNDIEKALQIEPLEEVIDGLTRKIKKKHIKRLKKGKCTIELGLIFEDILINLERVSDHCSNVAVGIITIGDDEYDIHEFYNVLDSKKKEEYENRFQEMKMKYRLP